MGKRILIISYFFAPQNAMGAVRPTKLAKYLSRMGHEVTVYEKRKQLLEAIRYVDLVIPEESWEQKRSDIREYHVDTFVMGDDWQGKFDFLQDLCQVVYLPRTPEISTTQIKKDLEK